MTIVSLEQTFQVFEEQELYQPVPWGHEGLKEAACQVLQCSSTTQQRCTERQPSPHTVHLLHCMQR